MAPVFSTDPSNSSPCFPLSPEFRDGAVHERQGGAFSKAVCQRDEYPGKALLGASLSLQCLKRDVLCPLPRLQIFQDCDPDFVEMCSKLMTLEKHHQNFVLCRLGDKRADTGNSKMWILIKGTVEFSDSNGMPSAHWRLNSPLMITNPSNFFSLLSTFSSGTVINTFTAEEDITPAFGECYDAHPVVVSFTFSPAFYPVCCLALRRRTCPDGRRSTEIYNHCIDAN